MKFMITYSIDPDHDKAAKERFLKTGAPPPNGIQMVGRWHTGTNGYILAETSDAKGIFEWVSQWSDLLRFTVEPVVEDADAGELLQRMNSA